MMLELDSFLLCIFAQEKDSESYILLFLFLGLVSAGGEGAAGGMLSIIALFICLRSFVAYQQASAGLALLDLPRHDSCACPSCAIAPPKGAFWLCEHCETRFDLFASRGRCPAPHGR